MLAQIATTIGMMLAGYLVGSIPFSFLVARAHGVDLRKVGSGNVGGANVWRNCGFGPFVVAAACDVLKGTLPTLAATALGLAPLAVVLVGVSTILGHTFSLFLNFKGGKAVATSGGVLLALAPQLTLIGVVAWAIAFAITRISSVGSLTAAAVVVAAGTAFCALGSLPLAYAGFVWLAGLLVVYLHRSNIQRLMNGTENRFGKLF